MPFDVESIRDGMRVALLTTAREAMLRTLTDLVDEEVIELAGARHSRRGASNPHRRHGRVPTTIFIDGQPVAFDRPRLRNAATNSEVELARVGALQSREALDADVLGKLVRGISTRNYDGALNEIANGLGMQKSAVSESFIRASKNDLDAINSRRLDEHAFVAVFIDGQHFADTAVLCALGVTTDGTKIVLGLRDGASENSDVVRDLLAELEERGLTLTPRALFVLDGGKALHRGVRDTFGERAVIQRCQQHKKRNVKSYLPKAWHAELDRKLSAAYGMTSYADAKRALEQIARWLEQHSESAAESLREGMAETLTVHRLGLTGALRKTFSTTNPIESLFSVVEEKCRRVKRWRGASMVLRWTASACVWHAKRMRRVRGFKDLPQLITALENHAVESSESSTRSRRRAV
ncbi:MAG: IS256 family transposase [Planctomycetota bacterium]